MRVPSLLLVFFLTPLREMEIYFHAKKQKKAKQVKKFITAYVYKSVGTRLARVVKGDLMEKYPGR